MAAFGFGSGAPRRAPGTWGTLAAFAPYAVLVQLSLPAYLVAILVAFVIGIYFCDKTSRDLGVHDHGGIVWDEFVGLWITLILIPPGWGWLFAGFVVFRFFDILKPWPIRWADKRVSGGFGIMLDDVLAGIYALAVLQLVAYLL
nr:phosphatidylglycerophosphatase A [Motiliproteus sediminis]